MHWLRYSWFAFGVLSVHATAAAEGSRAFDEILAGQGRDLRFEIVGFGSLNSWTPRVRALDVVVTGNISRTRYELQVEARTTGLASLFFRQNSVTRIEGEVTPDGLRPLSFSSRNNKGRTDTAIWNDNDVQVTTTYLEGARRDDALHEQRKRYITSALQKYGGTDFMTAVLSHMIGATTPLGRPCSGDLPIFDLVRRFDIVLAFDSEVFFNDGAWKGQVQQCNVRIRRISIDSQPDPDSKEDQEEITWKFAEIGPGKPNFLIAVDIRRANGTQLNFVVNKIVYKRT